MERPVGVGACKRMNIQGDEVFIVINHGRVEQSKGPHVLFWR